MEASLPRFMNSDELYRILYEPEKMKSGKAKRSKCHFLKTILPTRMFDVSIRISPSLFQAPNQSR